jgi:hypothetical protein
MATDHIPRGGPEMVDAGGTAAGVAGLAPYDRLQGRSGGSSSRPVRLRSREGGVSGPWSA